MVRFTNFAGKAFRTYGTQDKIIKKYFDNRNYKIFELNLELVKFNEEPFFEARDENLIKNRKSCCFSSSRLLVEEYVI
ncbi:MAG: hypothetical protein IIX47_05010 [Spirochaetaceae bacterium]|nr:hypothetical protein [Spirochaetaceae bacterium]